MKDWNHYHPSGIGETSRNGGIQDPQWASFHVMQWARLSYRILCACHSASLFPIPKWHGFFNHLPLAARTCGIRPHTNASAASRSNSFSDRNGEELARYSLKAAAASSRGLWGMYLWAQRVPMMVSPGLDTLSLPLYGCGGQQPRWQGLACCNPQNEMMIPARGKNNPHFWGPLKQPPYILIQATSLWRSHTMVSSWEMCFNQYIWWLCHTLNLEPIQQNWYNFLFTLLNLF